MTEGYAPGANAGQERGGRERKEETTADLGSNTILITGGASGIGLALAEQFLQAGSEGIVRGRREGPRRSLRG